MHRWNGALFAGIGAVRLFTSVIFVFSACDVTQRAENVDEILLLQDAEGSLEKVEQDEEGFQPATRVALQALARQQTGRRITEAVPAAGNSSEEIPALPVSSILRLQADVFVAEAELRRAWFRLRTNEEHLKSHNEIRDWNIEIEAKVGGAGKRTVRLAKDDCKRAEFVVEESRAKIREMQASLTIAKQALDAVSGDNQYKNYGETCGVYKKIWAARCEQVKARLNASKIAPLLLADDLKNVKSLSYKGYANKYQVRAAEFNLLAAEAEVHGQEDSLEICELNQKQFLLMQQELAASPGN